MKLIDLLVSHLGSNGGWPIGAEVCAQDNDCEVVFYSRPGIHRRGNNLVWTIPEGVQSVVVKRRIYIKLADDMDTAVVSRGQYEAALAAPQQQEWNGEGLPPVGCECEAFDGVSWFPVVIVGRYDGFAFAWNYDYRKTLTVNEEHSNNFRPIRTEAERKREEVIKQISHSLRANGSVTNEQLDRLYDDIADGKITRVTLK